MQPLRLWRHLGWMTVGVTAVVLSLQAAGILQLLEWAVLNHWFRLRPPEPRAVPIVLVVINEADIQLVERWPLSDAHLTQLISRIKQDRPIAIGLDLYRDLPVEPGHTDLLHLFRTTPNLIGITKAINSSDGRAVPPPPVLGDRGQIGVNDLLLDADGVIRRNLLSVKENEADVLSLGARLALLYLESQNIKPKPDTTSSKVHLGKATFERLSPNVGGYVHADNGGFQTLSNFLQVPDGLPSVTLTQVLLNQVPPAFFRDKLVFIGAKAESDWGDRFYTPYTTSSQTTWAGVEIHANVAAQIISSALDGRPILRGLPEGSEWLWVLGWASMGTILGWSLRSLWKAGIVIPVMIATLFISAYGAFLLGWWIVAIAPLLAFISSGLLSRGYWVWDALKQANQLLEQKVQERTQELIEKNGALEQARLETEAANQALERLARTDELTQVANRRFFNEYLYREWQRLAREQHPLSLMLIDIDFFKLYNDTYGHPAGDDCLAQVAGVLRSTVHRSTDLVSRYGGEEFAVVLPNTPSTGALQIANTIQSAVHERAIEHQASPVSKYVTLSIGIACVVPSLHTSPAQLINAADQALYQAKIAGRDRVVQVEEPYGVEGLG